MVQINRANVRPRVRAGPQSLLRRLQSFADVLPFVRDLSPVDRLLVATGVSLTGVVSIAYVVLLSGALTAPAGLLAGAGGGAPADPRLSAELRKTGLSEAALLRRGGGRRISIGGHALDAGENAVALDIAATLDCDALQEATEREWHTVLDGRTARAEEDHRWGLDAQDNLGGGGGSDEFQDVKHEDIEFQDVKFDDGAGGGGNEPKWRRRLFESGDVNWSGSGDANWSGDALMDDLPMGVGGNFDAAGDEPANRGLRLTARHLFCLAADALVLPTSASAPDPATHCDVGSLEVRDELLYLWSSARSQVSEDVLRRTLGRVTEHRETLRGHEVHVWYPDGDQGTGGMLRVINSGWEGRSSYNFDSEPADVSHDDLYRFHNLPKKFVGPDKLFVDVGSALGLTSMLISYLYPKTPIVAIEPAAPSWLIQNINYRCNLDHTQLQYVHPILAGVGTKHHDDNDSMMKMVWRPSFTTSTRSWNPEKDFDFAEDIELTVRLRTMRAILAEATPEDLPPGTPISVLNLDCEGCEYNLVPSLHEASFRSVGLVLGRTNWGYIPVIKKPSSDRARETHERVCVHYNFAKRCKECCDFPSLTVNPRVRDGSDGDSLAEKTVAEVAGEMCNDFEAWAKQSKLRDIPDDFGWNEMSAFVRD